MVGSSPPSQPHPEETKEFLDWILEPERGKTQLEVFETIPAYPIDTASVDVSPLYRQIIDTISGSAGQDTGHNIELLAPRAGRPGDVHGLPGGPRRPQKTAEEEAAALQTRVRSEPLNQGTLEPGWIRLGPQGPETYRRATRPPGGVARDRAVALAFVLPGLLVYVVFMLVPFLTSIVLQLHRLEWRGPGHPSCRPRRLRASRRRRRTDRILVAQRHLPGRRDLAADPARTAARPRHLGRASDSRRSGVCLYFMPFVPGVDRRCDLRGRGSSTRSSAPLNEFLTAIGLGDLTRSWLGDPDTALPACWSCPRGYRSDSSWSWCSPRSKASTWTWSTRRSLMAPVGGSGLWHIILPQDRPSDDSDRDDHADVCHRHVRPGLRHDQGRPGDQLELIATYAYRVAFREQRDRLWSDVTLLITVLSLGAAVHLRSSPRARLRVSPDTTTDDRCGGRLRVPRRRCGICRVSAPVDRVDGPEGAGRRTTRSVYLVQLDHVRQLRRRLDAGSDSVCTSSIRSRSRARLSWVSLGCRCLQATGSRASTFPVGRSCFFAFILGIIIPFYSIMIPLYFQLDAMGLLGSPLAVILPGHRGGTRLRPPARRLSHAGLLHGPAERAGRGGADRRRVGAQCVSLGDASPCGPRRRGARGPCVLPVVELAPAPRSSYLTGPDSRTMATGLYLFASGRSTETTLLAAASLLMTAPVIVFYLLFQRRFVRGVTAGALKG